MADADAPEPTATWNRFCPRYSGFNLLAPSNGISASRAAVSSKRARAPGQLRCSPGHSRSSLGPGPRPP
eukprot:7066665-Alexandrium_andersonii.AAC.1